MPPGPRACPAQRRTPGFVAGLDSGDLMALLAHCASLSVNAVRNPLDRRPLALAHADTLARAADLDMTDYWSVTGRVYLAQVTKARIIEALAESASSEAAAKLADLKKPAMVEAAEGLLSGTGWLPPLLRPAPVRDEGADADDGPLPSPRAAA